MRNRFLVVGAGFAGAVYARSLAEAGASITVIDRRDHIAGNAYDYVDANGVRVHRYGPHLFHTDNSKIFEWLERFGEWVPYEHRVRARLPDMNFVPLPINRDTINAVYKTSLQTEEDVTQFLLLCSIRVPEPRNAAEYLNSKVGVLLTDLFFRPYTKKMWGMDLEELSATVVKRIPLRFDRDDRYFPTDRFQKLPKNGYTSIFEEILSHKNISLQLSTAFDRAMLSNFDHCFNSMPIDEYFDYSLGELPYRSIRFHSETRESSSVPNWGVTNYTDSGPFTRETYWQSLPNHRVFPGHLTTMTVEEPCDYRDNNNERYYPVKTADNKYAELYSRYCELALQDQQVTFIGRCGTYQYLDMDQVINQSLQGVARFLEQVNVSEPTPTVVLSSIPAPPIPNFAVISHFVTSAGEQFFHLQTERLDPDTVYVAEAWVYVPSYAACKEVGIIPVGYACEVYAPADLVIRDRWQKISVQCRTPKDSGLLIPSILIRGDQDSVVFSSACTCTRAIQDEDSRGFNKIYRIAALDELIKLGLLTAQGTPRISFAPFLPDTEVAIPSVSFGSLDRPKKVTTEYPPDDWNTVSYSIQNGVCYTLSDVIVHGEQGLISIDDYIVEESLYNSQPKFLGFVRLNEREFGLLATSADPAIKVEIAAHAFCGYVGNRNYCHWWMDIVPALLVPPFGERFDGCQLLLPQIRQRWQIETLDLLHEAKGRCSFVGETTRVSCSELKFVPAISRSDMTPHPFRRALLESLRQRSGFSGNTGRRIYVTRRDSWTRKLLNEEDVIAKLSELGFEAMTLEGRSIREQIQIFAEASFVVGAHGAGLGNILFCPAGSSLCELHMNTSVVWSIRRIAAVKQMRYGCVIGQQQNDAIPIEFREWTVDVGELERAVIEMLSLSASEVHVST